MAHYTERLGLNTLELDLNNPRFPPTFSQEDAIDNMLDRIPDKILAMARDIVRHGLNPTTTPGVFRTSDGRSIVKDGNRRVTALKLIMNPKLAKDEGLRRKFEKIAAKVDRPAFRFIDCVVFDDEGEADMWVANNHQNDSSGIGLEQWGAIPKMRDSRNHGKPVPVLDVFELIQKKNPDIGENDFPITTLERIIKSKMFKDATGWDARDGAIHLDMPRSDFENTVSEIALDIYDKSRPDSIDSRSTNSTKNIASYISKKKEEGFFGNLGTPSSIAIKSGSSGKAKGAAKRKRKRTRTLIDNDIEWEIGCPRIKDFYEELRTLSVDAHPNAVSVLFRAFVETSSKWFCARFAIADKRHLNQRLREISKFLHDEHALSEDCKRSLDTVLEHSDDAVNFNQELNEYGHNYELNPSPTMLISTFDSVRCLLDGMYRYASEHAEDKGRRVYGKGLWPTCAFLILCTGLLSAIRAAKGA